LKQDSWWTHDASLILVGYLLGPTHLQKLGQKQDKYDDKNKEKG